MVVMVVMEELRCVGKGSFSKRVINKINSQGYFSRAFVGRFVEHRPKTGVLHAPMPPTAPRDTT